MTRALFDALAHPTLSGAWLGRDLDASFAALSAELEQGGFAGACAIGLAGVEGYSHEAFAAACRAHPRLVPIAGFNPLSDPGRLRALRDLGFVGIKIHPRFSGLTQRLAQLGPWLREAGDAGLVVFLCTYCHGPIGQMPAGDPYLELLASLQQAPATRVVLVHGGDVQLLRYAELVRFNANLLLDLSLTLMKYPGSSIDADLRFLFQHFDRRICVGSDWPEYRLAAVRQRFELFAEGLSADKRANIASRNLIHFLGLEHRLDH